MSTITEVMERYLIVSFTMYPVCGVWQGVDEASTIVEILSERELPDIRHLAHMMGKELSPVQKCILVTSQDVSGDMINCEPVDPAKDRFSNQA